MIEKTDRVLGCGEYDDLMLAYYSDKMKNRAICRESIHKGRLFVLLEIPLTNPLPQEIVVKPSESIARILGVPHSRTSVDDEEQE